MKSQDTKSKAAKPIVKPLGEHLAALLNPALREENRSDAYPTPQGFGEAPQAGFDSGPVTGLDPRLAKKLGLETSDAPAGRRIGALVHCWTAFAPKNPRFVGNLRRPRRPIETVPTRRRQPIKRRFSK